MYQKMLGFAYSKQPYQISSASVPLLLGISLLVISSLTNSFAKDVEHSSISDQIAANLLVTEADYLNAIPVVLSATRMLQPVNTAPASITVISRDMIDASGAQEIGDLLRLVPGFQVGYFNGTSMSLAYHGFTGNYDRRLQVLIDGRSAYMPFLSTVEWLSLPLDISEVEKIEVVRSSNAPVYGANAIQGVINIITRKPFEDDGFMLEGRWGTYDVTGTDGDIKNRSWTKLIKRVEDKKYLLRYAGSVADVDYRVSLGYQKDVGFKYVSDSKRLNLVHVTSQYQINAHDTLDVQLGARMGDMDTFANNVPHDPYRNKSVKSQYQSVSWSHVLGVGDELKVHLYHNFYDQNDEIRIADVYDWGVYFGTAERFDIEIERIFSLLSNVRVMIGSGVRLDRIKSKHLLAKKDYIDDKSARMFGNVEWYLTNSLILNGGIMVENNEQIGLYYSPRLAANFMASKESVFRASVTKSVRSPSILENNVDLAARADDGTNLGQAHISATNLEPERQYSVELGYMFNSRDQNVRFDTKLFKEYLRDGILEAAEYTLPDRPWVWGNNTWANIQGIESQLYFKPYHRFFMNLSHSRTSTKGNWHRYNNYPTGARDDDRDLSDAVPKDTFGGLFSFAVTSSINWSFTYYYMTEMAWLQDGNVIDDHDRLDTNIDWSRKISSESQLNISLTMQNMLDDYSEVQNENVFGQRVFLKAQYEW